MDSYGRTAWALRALALVSEALAVVFVAALPFVLAEELASGIPLRRVLLPVPLWLLAVALQLYRRARPRRPAVWAVVAGVSAACCLLAAILIGLLHPGLLAIGVLVWLGAIAWTLGLVGGRRRRSGGEAGAHRIPR